MAMASSSRKLPLLFLLLAAALLAPAVVPAQAEDYCGDSLAGLTECESFMFGGASAPSPACCAAYEAAFDADPFCLCYVADGTYGRATGYDVDVTSALRIPAACGQARPPIELCSMQGLVLPPYAPQGTPAQPPAAAAAPMAQPPSGSSEAPPSSTSPPPPAPTSSANRDEQLVLVLLVAAFLWWPVTL